MNLRLMMIALASLSVWSTQASAQPATAQPTVPAAPATLPFSPYIAAGDTVYVSGQLPLDRSGQVIGTTIGEQTLATIDRIEAILARAGVTIADVVKVTVYLTRAEDFRAFNQAYMTRFKAPMPARTTVVAGMVIPGPLIEIDVIAHRKAKR